MKARVHLESLSSRTIGDGILMHSGLPPILPSEMYPLNSRYASSLLSSTCLMEAVRMRPSFSIPTQGCDKVVQRGSSEMAPCSKNKTFQLSNAHKQLT